MCIYIYIYIYTCGFAGARRGPPDLPAENLPAEIARLKLSGKKSLWTYEFHP